MAFSFLFVLLTLMVGQSSCRPKRSWHVEPSSNPQERTPTLDDVAGEMGVDRFIDVDAACLYESLRRRPIIAGHQIVFSELNPTIYDDLLFQGWVELATYRAPIYPKLAKDFVANLHLSKEDGMIAIRNRVARRDFHLNEVKLATILGIPFDGIHHYEPREWEHIRDTCYDPTRGEGQFGHFRFRVKLNFLDSTPRGLGVVHVRLRVKEGPGLENPKFVFLNPKLSQI